MSLRMLPIVSLLFSSIFLSGTTCLAQDAPAATEEAAGEKKMADDKTTDEVLVAKVGEVMGYNMCRNFKSQNPKADYAQILKGIEAAAGDDDRSSYVFGYQMMTQLKERNAGITPAQLEAGIKKLMAGEELGVSDPEIQMLMTNFGQLMEQRREAEMRQLVGDNQAAGKAYLESQKKEKPNLKELKDGIYYEVLTAGEGPATGANAQVTFHYTGRFVDGEIFDSSEAPIDGGPAEPFTGTVNDVIPGFSKALQAMNKGARWRVIIPGEQAYGVRGSGGKIGPMETLVFELTLVDFTAESTEAPAP